MCTEGQNCQTHARFRRDVMSSERWREHAQYVTTLKIYFWPRRYRSVGNAYVVRLQMRAVDSEIPFLYGIVAMSFCQRLTVESWCKNLKQPLPTPYKRLLNRKP